MQIAIRPARVQDVQELAELLGQLFAIEADFAADPARQRAGLRLLLERPDAFVAVAAVLPAGAGPIVGMCSVQTLMSTAEGGPVGLIEDLVVGAKWRNHGVGARLLRAAEEWARRRGLRRLQLLADRENTAALKFYSRRGWAPTRLVGLRRFCHDGARVAGEEDAGCD